MDFNSENLKVTTSTKQVQAMDFDSEDLEDTASTVIEEELPLAEQVHPSYELIQKFLDPILPSDDKIQQILDFDSENLEDTVSTEKAKTIIEEEHPPVDQVHPSYKQTPKFFDPTLLPGDKIQQIFDSDSEDLEDTTTEEAKTIIEEEHPLGNQLHLSYKLIPKFFDPTPLAGDKNQQTLRKKAQKLQLKKQAEELLDPEELDELWQALEKHVTKTTRDKQKLIDFANYLKVISGLGARIQEFINVRLFFELMPSSEFKEKLEIVSIYNHTVRSIILCRGRISLSYYDEFGLGYLRESDLENYVVDMIPSLNLVSEGLDPSFETFYVCTVVKIVFFFLDLLHTGRVRISDIVSSGLLAKILTLTGKEQREERKNCFSLPAIRAIHDKFLSLDSDHNGLLSRQEMAEYDSGSLTTLFLDRAFEVFRKFDEEIDYKTFLEFYLAMENRKSPAGLHYIFRILDIYQDGYLTAETLFYFFGEIQEGSNTLVTFENLKNRIFDMAQPKDPLKITLKDLINCGQGGLAVSLLIEFNKFWASNEDLESEPYI